MPFRVSDPIPHAVGRYVEFYKGDTAKSVPVLYAGRYDLVGYSATIHEHLMACQALVADVRGETQHDSNNRPGAGILFDDGRCQVKILTAYLLSRGSLYNRGGAATTVPDYSLANGDMDCGNVP
jgi:hypothetical protein